jgi:hypothetical protein
LLLLAVEATEAQDQVGEVQIMVAVAVVQVAVLLLELQQAQDLEMVTLHT